MKVNLITKKYKEKGDLSYEYNSLRNLKNNEDEIVGFNIDNKDFKLSLETPVDIECQESYDGSVNLILNDDKNPPRIINTRWTQQENNTYKIINRDQINQSNLYSEKYIDRQTRLFRNVNSIPKIKLYNIGYTGQLKVGNYVFYMKYMDDDYNETDIVAQSSVVSIFHGTITDPKTCHGGLLNENTDKCIYFTINNIDTSFTYFKLYVYRTSSDENGILTTEAYKIKNDYEINEKYQNISINGFEEVEPINVEELNIQYNIVDSAKTQAQVQNMLFLANVTAPKDKNTDLQVLSLYINGKETVSPNSIGWVDETYNSNINDDSWQTEYYSPLNIYYNVGYWPDEIYRFGIVYIFNDDHLSPVYNLRGTVFSNNNKQSIDGNSIYNNYTENKDNDQLIPITSDFIDGDVNYGNTKGVFKFSQSWGNIINYDNKTIKPLGIQFTIPADVLNILRSDYQIKGFFIVRQKRIPTIIAQGYSIGVDRTSYIPMLRTSKGYMAESFKNESGTLTTNYNSRLIYTNYIQSSGLLCVDSILNKKTQSLLNTSEFRLERILSPKDDDGYANNSTSGNTRHYTAPELKVSNPLGRNIASLLYIEEEIPQKIHQDNGFSTKAGMQEDLKYSSYFSVEDATDADAKLVRGIFTPFIGTNVKLLDNSLYNIRVKNYSESYLREYINIRMNDTSEFYAISDRYDIYNDDDVTIESNGNYVLPICFRGDCFSATVTVRMQRNFTSTSVPINDTIVNPSTWKDNFKGVRDTLEWDKINKADVDAVPIGTWFTYKCFSNNNLGLRSIDPFHVDERALMGNSRSFYPLQGISIKSSNKIPESQLLNEGYSNILGCDRNYVFERVPYVLDYFDTRILFSNVQVDGEFKNSYKIFQGLSYEDIDRQYGAIVKILPWGVNLFCVFEHGIALIPVNEKALVQTTQGANIHMYGTGVLQKQVVLISDKYGSTWKDSIVRTPLGVYGVDANNHKIWRYTDAKKLEIISDFKMQRFLHDNINLKELEKYTLLGWRNIKTHYNAYKNDIMFTFYNGEKIWNICYNELLNKWITRYSWTPLLSENIDNAFFSYDLLKTRIFGILNKNLNRYIPDRNDPYYDDYLSIEYTGTNISKDGNQTGQMIYNNGKWNDVTIHMNIKDPYTYYNIENIIIRGYYYNEDTNSIDNEIISNVTTDKDNIDINLNVTKEKCTFKINTINVDRYNHETGNEDLKNEAELYNNWKEKTDNGNLKHTISISRSVDGALESEFGKYIYFVFEIKYRPYTIARLIESDTNISIENYDNKLIFGSEDRDYNIGLLSQYNSSQPTWYLNQWSKALLSILYVHGRSLNANEINYLDRDLTNQCMPTKWYDKQEPFEFEFIVSEPKGLHKIFDNLLIISNNVEPKSLEVEIIGDVYGFDKKDVFDKENYNDNVEPYTEFPKIIVVNKNLPKIYQSIITWDPITNEYSICSHQDCINMKQYGRRLGNIYYNEDKWYANIVPIYYKDKKGTLSTTFKTTKIRDKYAKIKVKYDGKNLSIITALQTMFTISYV